MLPEFEPWATPGASSKHLGSVIHYDSQQSSTNSRECRKQALRFSLIRRGRENRKKKQAGQKLPFIFPHLLTNSLVDRQGLVSALTRYSPADL